MVAALTQVDGEGAPLRGRGVEVAVLHMQVSRGDGLRSQAIEERDVGAAGDAHCTRAFFQLKKLYT